jgi:hypothetical protein
MGDKPETGAGGCLCGAVRFEASGEPVVTGHCHCADCRRHNGAALVTLVIFEADKVRFTKGERKIYRSSPGVGRAFCDQCGTPLTIESNKDDPRTVEFHISTFDNPDVYVPTLHWYHGRRIAWFDSADDLPRYNEMDDEEPYRHGPATNE